jgi:hypothetical protein
MNILDRILTLLSWSGVVALLLMLYRIAHFYEVTSRQPTHFRLFILPIVLLFLGGLCYAITGDAARGEAASSPGLASSAVRLAGDSLQLAGGLALIGLSMFLLRVMTGGRR